MGGPTFQDITTYRLTVLTRAMDAREKLAAQGTKLQLVYHWGDPSAPQGVMWVGDKDVLQSDAETLVGCGVAVKEILKAAKC